jgi:hypothetical protein
MALPVLDATFASAADLPRRQMLAKWLVEELGSGSIADYYDLPERYLWAKIAVAAGASRPEADYVSLPKNYAWSDIYNAVAGLIAPSNVLVSGAGTSAVNGAYLVDGTFNGKTRYTLVGGVTGTNSIAWYGTTWQIVSTTGQYTSFDNVAYPWLVTSWLTSGGSNPVPTVTEVPASSPNHADWSEKQALGHIAAAYRGDTANPEALATYIDWPWRYQVASIITSL